MTTMSNTEMTNTGMTAAEIQERFAAIVANSVRIDPALVTPDAYLDDLGAESLDLIEISMEVESVFKIWLPEKSILQMAIEVYGPGVIEQDGYLTAEGKGLLQARMPEDDAEHFQGVVAVKDVQRYFLRVSTWVRMIEALQAYTPVQCSKCGGVLAPSLGFRLKCAQCGEEVTLRSGDEINREWVQEFKARQPEATEENGGADYRLCEPS